MAINLSKDEMYSAIVDGAYKAIAEAIWADNAPGFWTKEMSDAVTAGAYRAVFEVEEKRLYGGYINHGN
jgi:hypothetical protein